MNRKSTLFHLWAVAAFVLAPSLLYSQCTYRIAEDFQDESLVDLAVYECGDPFTLLSTHWHNVLNDETDWVPHKGPTPTSGTGPFSFLSEGPLIEYLPTGFPIRFPAASSVNQYLLLEATDCCSNRAILESASLDFSEYEEVGFGFRYHMWGADMGSLKIEVSDDDGENWETVWTRPLTFEPIPIWTSPSALGSNWQTAALDLSEKLGGTANGLIRVVGTVGLGERSDIGLDDLTISAKPDGITIDTEGTVYFGELQENCLITVEFDRPSDAGLPCLPSPGIVDHADLWLNLNLGDQYRYGGTDLGAGVNLSLNIAAVNSAGDTLPDCSSEVEMTIADSRHPETILLQEFSACYQDIDHFAIIVQQLDTADAEYPQFVDDLELDVRVDIAEKVDANGSTVTLSTPLLRMDSLLPAQFSWSDPCGFPLYRFQLLRLYDVGGGTCSSGSLPDIKADVSESAWEMSSLTLEVGQPDLDLTILEGTGYYAWRVMPIGNRHEGKAGNDLNHGEYTGFSGLSTGTSAPQLVCDGASWWPEPAVFWYEDPMDSKNRQYEREFSRDVSDGQETLMKKETAHYMTGTMFHGQTVQRRDGDGSALVKHRLRDFVGNPSINLNDLPIEEAGLDYVEGVALNAEGDAYGPEDFASDENLNEPREMYGMLDDYYSESNPDASIPNAQGYPFFASKFTADATGRPISYGGIGATRRLREDGAITKYYYSSVSEDELVRVFGKEAPDPQTVTKKIHVTPDRVTVIEYMDVRNRIIAKCHAKNSEMDTEIIGSLAPETGFDCTEDLESQVTSGNPYRWSVSVEKSYVEQTNFEISYLLEGQSFETFCGGYCGQCDYQVSITLKNRDEDSPMFQSTVNVSGDQLACGSTISPSSFDTTLVLDPGQYTLSKVLTMNNTDEDGNRHLEAHQDRVEDAVRSELSTVTDTLNSLLDLVASGDNPTLEDFHEYCTEYADSVAFDDDGESALYYFLSGTCDTLEIPAERCPYDCDPATRDFEAYFTERAAGVLIDLVSDGIDVVTPRGSDDVVLDISIGRDWFPDWISADEPGDPRNLAADNYAVNPGEFNQLIENLISDGEDAPEIYDGYTCYNIYYQLDAIASEHVYWVGDTSIVDKLMDALGRHMFDSKAYPATGDWSGSSDGWKTHPHQYVRFPIGITPGTSACDSSGTPFDLLDVGSLDYGVDEEREQIEQAYYLLHTCLWGDSQDEIEEDISESEAGSLTEFNIAEKWNQDCLDMAEARLSIFEEEVDDLLVEGGFTPGTATFDQTRICWVGQLIEHAKSYCKIESTVIDSLGASVSPLGFILSDAQYFKVFDNSATGNFVRYLNQEWGPKSEGGDIFRKTTAFTTTYESVTPIATGLEVREYFFSEFQTNSRTTLADSIARMCYGAFELCDDNCGDGFEFVGLESIVEVDTVFQDDFETDFYMSYCSGCCGGLPCQGPITAVTSSWKPSHTTGGTNVPTIGFDSFGYLSDHYLELFSGPNHDTTAILGNGAWKEANILLQPNKAYRLELELGFMEGNKVDNLFVSLVPWTNVGWLNDLEVDDYPSTASPSLDVLYPPAGAQVIGDFKNEVRQWGGARTKLTASFTPDISLCTPSCDYLLHVYSKQEIGSDSVWIEIDDIKIIELDTLTTCDSLFVRYYSYEPEPDTTEIETCEQSTAVRLLNEIFEEEETIVNQHIEDVEIQYNEQCPPAQEFLLATPLNYYHYTLYYYDVAGNLVQTVPPKGVDADDGHTRADTPNHGYATTYTHDVHGNILCRNTPDGDTVKTWFDQLGRIRFTQTAQDQVDHTFRYVCYDRQDRPIRGGVRPLGSDLLDAHINEDDWPQDNSASPCMNCYERTFSVYEEPMPASSGFEQSHLIDRLSFLYTDEGDTTAYSYGARGYVEKEYHSIHGLGGYIIGYTRDEANGNVLCTAINEGRADQFFLKNSYDENGKVVASFSSDDGIIWHRDAQVEYRADDVPKRKILGHYEVQGLDFTYNLHGQTIGINTPQLDASDPGQDGYAGFASQIPKDVFGLRLSYYSDDHNRAGYALNLGANAFSGGSLQHDGKIIAQSFQHRHLFGTDFDEQVLNQRYSYDELARLSSSELFTWGSSWTSSNALSTSYGYDKNGNLTSVSRTDEAGNVLDDLTLSLIEGTNQTDHVNDGVTTAGYALDLENQSTENYAYDSDGHLISDVAEGIDSIEWRSDGQVQSITYSDGEQLLFHYNPSHHRSRKVLVHPDGHSDTTWYFRNADGDFLGSVISTDAEPVILEYKIGSGLFRPQDTIPFASELPDTNLWSRTLGLRNFEIKDPVGSVRDVVSDLKLALDTNSNDTIDAQLAIILTAKDYYPFGMVMPGRNMDTTSYRFAFHGGEADDEIKGQGNSYSFNARFYDPRLGRWLSTDPREPDFPSTSTYSAMANNPVMFTDMMGSEDELGWTVSFLQISGKVGTKSSASFIATGELKAELSAKVLDAGIDSEKGLFIKVPAVGECSWSKGCEEKGALAIGSATLQILTSYAEGTVDQIMEEQLDDMLGGLVDLGDNVKVKGAVKVGAGVQAGVTPLAAKGGGTLSMFVIKVDTPIDSGVDLPNLYGRAGANAELAEGIGLQGDVYAQLSIDLEDDRTVVTFKPLNVSPKISGGATAEGGVSGFFEFGAEATATGIVGTVNDVGTFTFDKAITILLPELQEVIDEAQRGYQETEDRIMQGIPPF